MANETGRGLANTASHLPDVTLLPLDIRCTGGTTDPLPLFQFCCLENFFVLNVSSACASPDSQAGLYGENYVTPSNRVTKVLEPGT